MFSNKHFEVRVQKDPPSLDQMLKEPMPVEQKIQIVKELGMFAAGLYTFCKVVDTCLNVAGHAAVKVISS